MFSAILVKVYPTAIFKLFMVPHQNFSMRATKSFVKSIETPTFCTRCQVLSEISVKISYFLPTLRPLRQTQSPSPPGKFFLQVGHLASQEEHLSKLPPHLPISRYISNRISVYLYRVLPIVSSCVSLSSLKPVYPTMVRGKLPSLWCSKYWKMHLQMKTLNLDIFTFVPPYSQTLLQVLVITRRLNWIHSTAKQSVVVYTYQKKKKKIFMYKVTLFYEVWLLE